MKITLHVEKSLEQNAALYFEKAKKVAKKIEGAKTALEEHRQKLASLEKKRDKELTDKQERRARATAKKEWFEKFRWFISSEGFLVVGGRDATSNEVVIKKHTEDNDIVFHTDMAGSPFFVIKTEGKTPGESTLNEVGNATVTFSRAWKMGLSNSPVFYVNPEQVSKKAQSGEYMSKGAFMIYGKTNYIDNSVDLAIGVTSDGKMMGGPLAAIRVNCTSYLVLQQGDEKASGIAKLIHKKLSAGTIDEIIRALPAGEFKIKKG
jgi:predicted ribosome quality control (RQC) complex YloA/Tae2 family protein